MRLLKSAFWLYALTIIIGTITYTIRIYLARNLSVSDYGLFWAVFSFIFFFAPFRDLGLTEATIFYMNKYLTKKDYKNIKTVIVLGLLPQIILGIIFAILFIAFSNTFAIQFFKDIKAKEIIITFSILFGFETLLPTIASVFLAMHKVVLWKTVDLIKFILILLLTVFFFQTIGKTPFNAALARVTSSLIAILMFYFLFFIKFSEITKAEFNKKNVKKLFRDMIKYALPITFSTAAGILLVYSDTILLTILKGTESVGYYNIAIPIVTIFLALLGPVQQIVFPKISQWYHSNNKQTIKQFLNIYYNNILMLLLPFALIFFAFPKLVITTLFGKKYIDAYLAVKIFSISFIFIGIRNINFSIISGIGKAKERSIILFIGAIVNVILDLIFITLWDYNGAALATSIGYVVMTLLTTNLVLKNYPIKIDFKMQLKVILSNIIFYFTIVLLRKIINLAPLLEAFVVVMLSLSIYVLILIYTKVITQEKIKRFIELSSINL